MILADRVAAARQAVDRETGEARAVALAGQRAEAKVAELAAGIELHSQVNALLTTVGEARQETVQRQVEGLVTRGLQAIFSESLSFHLVTSVRGNQAQVDFVIRSSHGGEVIETPVMEARGGGMAAAVGFMLRLVVLLLTPGARRLLVLDETFAHVSAEYEPALAEFLREVAAKAGVQILMITHSDAFGDAADVYYQARPLPDGTALVKRL